MKKIFLILPLLFLGIFLLPKMSFAATTSTWNYQTSTSTTSFTYNFSSGNNAICAPYFYIPTAGNITGGSNTNRGFSGSLPVPAYPTEYQFAYMQSVAPYDCGGGYYINTLTFDTYEGVSISMSDTSGGELPPAGYTPSISLLGPIADTSLPNFLNWIVKFNVATSSNMLYQIVLDYGTSTAYGFSNVFPAGFQGTQETAGYLDIINTIRKGVSLDNGTWHVKATLEMVNGDMCPNWVPCSINSVDTGDISFTIDNSLPAITGSYFGTSTDPATAQLYAQYATEMTNPSNPASFFGSTGILATSTPFQTPTSTCTAPSDWTDIGGGINYGLCETVWALFYPSNISYATLQGAFQNLETAPPFAYVFVPLQAMQTAGSNLASTTPQNLNYHLALTGYDNIIPSSTISVVSSDELNNLMGTSTEGIALHQQLFQVEDYAMLLLLIAGIVGIIVKFG